MSGKFISNSQMILLLGNSQSCLEIVTEEFNGKHCMNIVDFDLFNNTKNAVRDENIFKGIKV